MPAVLSAGAQRSGDKRFLIELYQQYDRLMFSTAKKYVSALPACEDIVQDSLVRLIPHVELLRGLEPDMTAGYLVATVKNTAVNYLRRQGLEAKLCVSLEDDALSELDSGTPPLDELMQLAERRDCLCAVWETLSAEDCALLRGKYILGYSGEELAGQLGCSADSVRMRLTRARRRAYKLIMEQKGDVFYDEA